MSLICMERNISVNGLFLKTKGDDVLILSNRLSQEEKEKIKNNFKAEKASKINY